ncbi:MAG: site-2 protease family protein [Anaerolineae bacterium]|nr:site-2 protease family protein [Anaerolineae bacterium]
MSYQQRPQYSYQPPQRNFSWFNRLKEPPLKNILIVVGILLAIFLAIRSPRFGASLIILLVAFPVHELAHAWTAYKLGDATPKYDGRLTLNPFAHLDLFGSLLILTAGLGWAKPVRFNPSALRMDPRMGAMIVAAAGPISNLILAVIGAVVWNVISPLLGVAGLSAGQTIGNLVFFFVLINVALFFFNLIPLAPLDGFTVLRGLLPYQLAYQLDRIQPYSIIIFLVLFILGVLGPLIFWPAERITYLLL